MLTCTIPTRKKEKEKKKKGEGEEGGEGGKEEERERERGREKYGEGGEEGGKEKGEGRLGEGRGSLVYPLPPSVMTEENLAEDLSEYVTARQREMLFRRGKPGRKLGKLHSLNIDDVPMIIRTSCHFLKKHALRNLSDLLHVTLSAEQQN